MSLNVPPLPSFVVGREDEIKSLKSKLGVSPAKKIERNIQCITAIKGWAGIGKSTIASLIAHDPDIAKAFPDGVLWVSLGPTPNLLQEFATLGRTLGTDTLLYVKSIEEASEQLRILLRDAKMLLVIDNVCDTYHANPFMVGGRDCATIITTRITYIANELAPSPENIFRLPVLSFEEGIKLLGVFAPEVVTSYPKEALELVRKLDGLPLAIQVAGRILHTEGKYRFDIRELIAALQEGERLLMSNAPSDRMDIANETTPTIAALLQTSVKRLNPVTQDCFAYLGAFAPKPATFDISALKAVWDIDDPQPIVRDLVERGLLEYIVELDRYQIHALLVMLAKSMLQ